MTTLAEPRQAFARKVRYYMDLRGWRDAHLAVHIARSVSQVSRILAGQSGVNLEMLYRIAAALEVSPSQLVEIVPPLAGRGTMRGLEAAVQRCLKQAEVLQNELRLLTEG